MELTIIGIQYRKWKGTKWRGQIVPIEIDYSEAPEYKNRHAVKVYQKELGLLPEDKDKLPIGCQVFVTLQNKQNHVRATLIDKPKDWKIPLSDSSFEKFSEESLSEIDRQWGYDSRMYKFEEIAQPIRFHEWLIRKELDDEDIDEYVISSYLHFREWLDDRFRHYSLKLSEKARSYHEDSYGYLELEEYSKYSKAQQEEIITEIMVEKILSGASLAEARRQFPGAERVDDDDAVFDDEGSWLGML